MLLFFFFFFLFGGGGEGGYSSEVPDLMNRVCVCLDALCQRIRVLLLEGKMWGYGGGCVVELVCVYENSVNVNPPVVFVDNIHV